MTYAQQRAKERELAVIRKRKIRQRNNRIAWLVIIGIVLVIFALGTLFGYHLTSRTPAGQADITESAQIAAKIRVGEPTAKVIELTSTALKPTGIEAKILFARFYESIKAFYEDPENRRRFEEWQKARKEVKRNVSNEKWNNFKGQSVYT